MGISLHQAMELFFAFLETAAREEALTLGRLEKLQERFMGGLLKSLRLFQDHDIPLGFAA